jgi:predicted signal transduction protein with EAL and GGDEF domain
LGGDEFGVLVTANESAAEPESVLALTERIIATLEQPILYEEQPIDVSASIGIAMFPDHASDTETLLRNADIAMYVAKADRSGFAIYDPHFDTTQQEHLSLLSELRRAIDQDQLQLYYQPKVTLASSSVTAAEALIRWNHPTRGLVPPAMFIPFAELTGYIKVLSRWVLEAAVRQCAAWRRDGFDIHVSVNVSARDLMSRELPEFVAELLARHEVPASSLGLEITESALMQDPALAQKVLQRLAEIGLQLSIDDYGTGYSSLSYIMRLPVNELKIDRSLVSHMAENSDQATIVRSTIELGHNLGLSVVAEGVETAEGYALLRSLGCDSVQGYFISPPLPADAFCGWIEGSVIRSRVPESLWKGMAEADSSSVRGVG